MGKLYFSYGINTIHLDGASVAAPVMGAHYSPGSGQRSWDDLGRQVIIEEISVELAGTYRQITDWINSLSVLISSLQVGAAHSARRLFLNYLEPDGTYPWFSELVSIRLHIDPHGLAQRSLGQQLLTLKITRLDEWMQDPGGAPLLRLTSGAWVDGVQGFILNHTDLAYGHANMLNLNASEVHGNLPTKNTIRVGINQAGRTLGTVLLGCGWLDHDGADLAAFTVAIEAQDLNAGAGVTKTQYSGVADCTDATYCNFAWSTTAETLIGNAAGAGIYGKMWHGRPLKPLMRLQAAQAYTDLYLKLKAQVSSTSVVVYETEWILYQAGSNFIEFPTLFCPPEGLTEGTGLDIVLYAMKTSAAAYNLPIDTLQIWPVDGGFRRLKPLAYETGAQYLVDDAYNDQVYWSNNTYSYTKPSVVGQGPRLQFLPGRQNAFYVLNLTAGTTWVIDDQLTVDFNTMFVKRDL